MQSYFNVLTKQKLRQQKSNDYVKKNSADAKKQKSKQQKNNGSAKKQKLARNTLDHINFSSISQIVTNLSTHPLSSQTRALQLREIQRILPTDGFLIA